MDSSKCLLADVQATQVYRLCMVLTLPMVHGWTKEFSLTHDEVLSQWGKPLLRGC